MILVRIFITKGKRRTPIVPQRDDSSRDLLSRQAAGDVGSDLKSTMSAGRSFHTFTTLMLKKDVHALQWLKGFFIIIIRT